MIDGHLGVEPAKVLVEQVVAEVAAELGERLGDLRLLLGRDVPPGAAVGQGRGRGDRTVGVDVVAAAQEEVGVELPHRVVDPVAAEVRVDAPALPRQVPRPQEPHPVAPPYRRRTEGAGHRLTGAARVVRVGEQHAVVDLLARRQPVQPGRTGEVGARTEQRTVPAAGVAERLGGGRLDDHPGRPVGPHPHQPRVGGHIARSARPTRPSAARTGRTRAPPRRRRRAGSGPPTRRSEPRSTLRRPGKGEADMGSCLRGQDPASVHSHELRGHRSAHANHT